MTTYTDRQKACIEALQGIVCEYTGSRLESHHCETIFEFLEVKSPITGFSEPDGGADVLTDECLTELAVDHLHIDYDRMPAGVVPLLRAAIALAAPSQPAAPAEQPVRKTYAGIMAEELGYKPDYPAPSTAAQGATSDDFRDQSIIDWISCLKADSGCKQAALEHLEELYQRLATFTRGGDKPVAYVCSVGATRVVLMNGAKLNDFDELYARPAAPTPVADSGANESMRKATREMIAANPEGARLEMVGMAREIRELRAAAKPVSLDASTAAVDDGQGVPEEFKEWFRLEWSKYQDKAISDGMVTSMTWALKGYRAARASMPERKAVLTDEQREALLSANNALEKLGWTHTKQFISQLLATPASDSATPNETGEAE